MWAGFLEMGGTEVVNSGRSLVYARESDCPIYWHKQYEDHNTADALLDDGYSYAAIDAAPWYDPDEDDLSRRFYGVYGISIEGMSDSMRTATVTQKLGSGGIISGIRETTRQIRVRAFLSAEGMDAMEYGTTWLREMVGGRGCSMHSSRCGMTDAGFFVDNPPGRDDDPAYEDDLTYIAAVRNLRRYTHNVAATSGPFVVQEVVSDDRRHHGRIVEFTLTSEVPWVYGEPRQIDIVPTVPFVVQDAPFNLAPYPSAEMTDGSVVVVAQNYSTNPSVETDATGWSAVADGAQILLANVVGSRVTELSAAGGASFRAQFTAPSNGAGGWVGVQQQVTIPNDPYARFSVNMWGSGLVFAGTATLGPLEIYAFWRQGSTVLRTDILGTIEGGAGSISAPSITPPATYDNVIVRVRQAVTSWSSGADIRVYGDALAVTLP